MFSIPRSSGILLHPTSLPGRFGIGEIGPEAHHWLEALERMGQRLWQVLPLGPAGYADSPFQSTSSHAGNPLLISFDALRNDGVLTPQDLAMVPAFPSDRVDFAAAGEVRMAFLKLAARRFIAQCDASPPLRRAFEVFCNREAGWLDDHSLFTALKQDNEGRAWTEWPRDLALRKPAAMAGSMARLDTEIEEVKAQQFFFFRQWRKLRARAQELGVRIIGEMPFLTAHDSAEVWARPELYDLDERGHPLTVAGAPPDGFSATGQRWGSPLYQWGAHQAEGFAWWQARLRKTLELVDIVRIGHFRGMAACWAIPAAEMDGLKGLWVETPGDALLEALHAVTDGSLPVIAEDIGVTAPEVAALRQRHGIPGMKVIQGSLSECPPKESVAYTGTHDHDTVQGRHSRTHHTPADGGGLNWDCIRAVWASRSNLALTPMQDLLGLGSEARMNIPGQTSGCWDWRFTWEQLTPEMEARMHQITADSAR